MLRTCCLRTHLLRTHLLRTHLLRTHWPDGEGSTATGQPPHWRMWTMARSRGALPRKVPRSLVRHGLRCVLKRDRIGLRGIPSGIASMPFWDPLHRLTGSSTVGILSTDSQDPPQLESSPSTLIRSSTVGILAPPTLTGSSGWDPLHPLTGSSGLGPLHPRSPDPIF